MVNARFQLAVEGKGGYDPDLLKSQKDNTRGRFICLI